MASRTYLMLWSRRVRAPLTNVRVVEFGQLIAGPLVGTMLGDFGAEVIKVEPPAGDQMRDWGQRAPRRPHAVVVGARTQQALRGAGPQGPRGRGDRAASSARGADVVVENFRPGAMERWGLGPRTCMRQPGMHLRARERLRPATRATATGPVSRPAARRSRACATSTATRAGAAAEGDLAGRLARGLVGVPGHPARAVRARHARRRRAGGGRGDPRRLLCDDRVAGRPTTRSAGVVREPSGSRLPRIAPSNVYRSADERWVVIAANHDTLWRRLAAAMGRPELAEDPRYADHAARGEHQDELDEMIGAWAAAHTAAELDELLADAGVVCAPVNTAADILADPHFRERGLIDRRATTRSTASCRCPGVVPLLEGTPGAVRRPARWEVGADTAGRCCRQGIAPARLDDVTRIAAPRRAGRERHAAGVGARGALAGKRARRPMHAGPVTSGRPSCCAEPLAGAREGVEVERRARRPRARVSRRGPRSRRCRWLGARRDSRRSRRRWRRTSPPPLRGPPRRWRSPRCACCAGAGPTRTLRCPPARPRARHASHAAWPRRSCRPARRPRSRRPRRPGCVLGDPAGSTSPSNGQPNARAEDDRSATPGGPRGRRQTAVASEARARREPLVAPRELVGDGVGDVDRAQLRFTRAARPRSLKTSSASRAGGATGGNAPRRPPRRRPSAAPGRCARCSRPRPRGSRRRAAASTSSARTGGASDDRLVLQAVARRDLADQHRLAAPPPGVPGSSHTY